MHGLNLKNKQLCMKMANMLKNSHAVSKAVLVSIIVIVLAICVTTGFVAYQLKPTATPTATPTASPTSTPTPTPQPTDDQSGTAAQEKISIQAVSYDTGSKVLTIYVQSITSGDVTPIANGIIIKDTSGNTVTTLGIGTISPTAIGNALAAGRYMTYNQPSIQLA